MARSSGHKTGGGFLSYFTGHRTAASFLMIVMLGLGIIASTQIRSQFFPDVVIDTVTVTVGWPGAGPEEVDGAIVALLEPALQTIEGVESTSAVSKDSSGTVTLVLESGWDMARATEEIKAAVENVRNLPENADEPVVRRGIWKDKVTELVISGPISPDQLGGLGDQLVSRLFRAGITRTTITGVEAPQIEVTVPEVGRVRNDLGADDVAGAIAIQARTKPAGDVAGGTARLRAGEEQRTAEDIRNMVVRTNPDGSKLFVRNVARVEVLGADAGRAYYLDGAPAVLIRIDRTSQGDAIAMQATAERIAEEFRQDLPEGVKIRLINSRAEDITDRLDILMENGLTGLALVLLILFLFLSARTAFWVALGIPVSMFAAVGVMYAAGLTINMMSLFALIITLGIVVDDAIVVAEHSDYRARRLGEGPGLAPLNAVRQMLGPVFSSTATTVLAFIGLLFIGGSFGSLIADIPMVVIAVLIASLIESFLILPNHMRHSLEAGLTPRWYDMPSAWFNRGLAFVTERLFVPVMRWVIRLRYLVLALTLALFSISLAAVIRGEVPWQFFTPPESSSISGNFAFLPGATREQSLQMTQELVRAAQAVGKNLEQEHGTFPIVHALAQVGGTTSKGLPGQDMMDPDTLGAIDIALVGSDARPYSATDFVRALQQEVRRPPSLAMLSFRSQGLGPAGDSLSVNFYGGDSFTLKAAATELIAELSAYPEVTGLEDSLAYGKDDMVLQLTPLGESLGFTTSAIGAELFDRLNGITAAEFPAGVRTTEVTVRLPEAELTADFLTRTLMRTPSGEYVPLGEVATVTTSVAFSTVERENGLRLINVSGTLSEDDAARAAEIAAALRTDILPRIAGRHNLDWELSGLALQAEDFLDEAMIGFLVCILGIYLVLGWVFSSWTRPLIVLAIIPFGLIGTVWGHGAFGLAMSLFTVIGFIGMSGIVINDAIVLVTTIQERAEQRDIVSAAIGGTKDRLRPIMLTTLTTVLGLAPLMFEASRQALFLKPTVITLVFGLSVGFFVVLALVPSLLVMQADVAGAIHTLRIVLASSRVPRRVRLLLGLAAAIILALNLFFVGSWAVTGSAVSILLPLTAEFPDLWVGLVSLLAAIAASVVVALLALFGAVAKKPKAQ